MKICAKCGKEFHEEIRTKVGEDFRVSAFHLVEEGAEALAIKVCEWIENAVGTIISGDTYPGHRL